MDDLFSEQRKNMQHIREKDSGIEIILRWALRMKGYRYQKNCTVIKENKIQGNAMLYGFHTGCRLHMEYIIWVVYRCYLLAKRN